LFDHAARRLGVSLDTVVRLVGYGKLEAAESSRSNTQQVSVASVLAFEKRRAEGDRIAAKWSRDLDAMSAPLE